MIIPAYSITTHLTFRMCLERCRQNLHTLSRCPPIHTALRSQHDKRRLRKLFQRHFRVLRSEELLCDDISRLGPILFKIAAYAHAAFISVRDKTLAEINLHYSPSKRDLLPIWLC